MQYPTDAHEEQTWGWKTKAAINRGINMKTGTRYACRSRSPLGFYHQVSLFYNLTPSLNGFLLTKPDRIQMIWAAVKSSETLSAPRVPAVSDVQNREKVTNITQEQFVDTKIEDIKKASLALENEFDDEIEKVIKSTDQPGKLDEAKLRARSAKIGRIEEKLKHVKRKSRTLSAHKKTDS